MKKISKKNKKEKWPSVSFIVCTYNCRDLAERCIESIKNQDYPGKIEIMAVDSYSKDGTIEMLKEKKVKIIFSESKPEGKRGAKWSGYKNAKNDILIYIDSDNKLMEKDWTRKMVKPLIKNKDVNFCVCRMAVVKSDKMINRYLSLMGTDPFVDYKSIDSLLALRKLKLKDNGEYYTYKITPENFIITGGYYFTCKKKTLDKIGGYTQDTDVVYNLAKNNLGNVAIVKDVHLHHLISDSIKNFFRKKISWAKIFFEKQQYNRDFNWLSNDSGEKHKIYTEILINLLFITNFFIGIKMAIKDKESAWLLHPVMKWLTTTAYLYSFFVFYISKI